MSDHQLVNSTYGRALTITLWTAIQSQHERGLEVTARTLIEEIGAATNQLNDRGKKKGLSERIYTALCELDRSGHIIRTIKRTAEDKIPYKAITPAPAKPAAPCSEIS